MNCVTHCVIYNEMCLRHKWNPFSSPAMIVSSLLLRWWFFHRLDTIQFLLQTVRLAALHAKWIPYCLDKLNSIILNYRCQTAKQNNSFKVWEENLYFSIAKTWLKCSHLTACLGMRWCKIEASFICRLLCLGYFVRCWSLISWFFSNKENHTMQQLHPFFWRRVLLLMHKHED